MTSRQIQSIRVPLGKDAHHWAQQFAAEQDTPQKSKRVYLNTLAVYAVNSYLSWLMVDTDLTQGDIWHPGLRALFDVADLVLSNIGKLECRPVLPGEVAFDLPMDVAEDLIGYVAVQFNQQLDSVELLGFAPAMTDDEPPDKLQLAELQSLETLIDAIHNFSRQLEEPLLVNLRQWLEGVFNEDWQPPRLVLTRNFRSISGRTNSTSRSKVINLAEHLLVLVVQLTPTDGDTVDIRLRLCPDIDTIYLPENLHLIVFDEAEIPCMEAQATNAANWIELEFSCELGEKFSVKVILGRVSLIQKFTFL
ncbi:MAG: DUF1822 family protein [Stigonema ocellatum SAG 48.90 = DSM 106950]|nr:DUF1822 family protein [Stigonema ocellatum SAG 48.90 = DSM 106950]